MRAISARVCHAQLGVQVRQRLVHEEDRGIADDRTAERDALALASGELSRLAVEVAVEVEDPGGVDHRLVDLLLRGLAQLQPECHVVAHAHVRIESVALEDHGDVAIARGQVVHDAIADAHLPARDVLEAGDHAQGSCLAAP